MFPEVSTVVRSADFLRCHFVRLRSNQPVSPQKGTTGETFETAAKDGTDGVLKKEKGPIMSLRQSEDTIDCA